MECSSGQHKETKEPGPTKAQYILAQVVVGHPWRLEPRWNHIPLNLFEASVFGTCFGWNLNVVVALSFGAIELAFDGQCSVVDPCALTEEVLIAVAAMSQGGEYRQPGQAIGGLIGL